MRTVELPPALARKLWTQGADATGAMFHTRTGGRLSDRNLRRVLDTAAATAGVAGVSHHTFRHTRTGRCCSIRAGASPKCPRHASPKITAEVYAHAMPDWVRELGFLDELGNGLGNTWATHHPQTPANTAASESAKVAL